ncbi:MAG: FAD-binding oxidoreductase [Devosia sp.]|nr:FAD-binding oxidoreductase [Devosia sp.]
MLATALRGRVVTPAAADYDALRLVAMDNYDRRPAALIRVANAADVAAVVNFARATDLPLAIRSGGHSTAGYSGVDHGLVIDLRALDGIEIDVAARTAWVGSGLTAGAVTRAVEQHGLIVGFGDSGTVGVGGLTLGGGVGYLVRKHGLTIDSLLAAEVVTADGDIVMADAERHPDLFWALRGGGGNFGVVTRLQFRLHPLPFFSGGPLVLPATAEVIAAYVAAAEAAPETLSTIGNVMPLPPVPFVPAEMHGRLALVAMLAYSGERDGAEAALAPFSALATPIPDLVGEGPYSSMYAMDPPPEVRTSVAIRSRYVTRFGVAEAAALLAALEACDAPMKLGQLRILGGAHARVPSEATAFGHRDGRLLVAFMAMYGDRSRAAGYERWAIDAMASLRPGAQSPAYVNFLAQEGATGLAAAYPAATWQRLREIKRRYDPENLFRLNQNIPPAA